MSFVKSLYNAVLRGIKGKNIGLSTGFKRLDSYTYGVQRGYITVIGGDTGSGKSSFSLYSYVYRILMDNPKKPINILIYSFELSGEVIFAKLLSLYIKEVYGKTISFKDILSYTDVLSEKDLYYINDSMEWLYSIEQKITIIDKSVNADGLYATCLNWISTIGSFEKITEFEDKFIPKDPEQYSIVLVDHISLLRTHGKIKEEIDTACQYLIYLRNKCNLSIYIVQQLNRNFKSMARRTVNNGDYNLVQLDDFSDSSAPTQAAEVVIALFHPFREKLKKCEGYDIKELKDKIRITQLIKNRYGESDKSLGVNFFGSIGLWRELPKAEFIEDYNQYKYIDEEEMLLEEKKQDIPTEDNKNLEDYITF